MTSVSVIVVGFGDEPLLHDSLEAIRADLSPTDEILLVDNGVRQLPPLDGVRLITSTSNLGFGSGANRGAEAAHGDVLVFVNSDAVVRRGAILALVETLRDPLVGLATGLVLLDGALTDVVNAGGNPVHYLGISWSGGYGEPASEHQRPRQVASVSGALFATRRHSWDRLGGFDPLYFLYHEDADLSLRCHLAGLEVRYCSHAVATHAYAFGKNVGKMMLLERNRLVTVLTDYPAAVLIRVLPAIVITEPLLLIMAIRQGWGRQKLLSWWWLAPHARVLVSRRRRVQRAASAPWRQVARLLESKIAQGNADNPAGMRVLNVLLAAYWRLASWEGVGDGCREALT